MPFINMRKRRYWRFIVVTMILLALSLMVSHPLLRGRLLTGDRSSELKIDDDDTPQQQPSLSTNNHTLISVSRLEHNEEIRNHEKQQSSSSQQPLHLVICAIIKDEAPYLQEWIEHHKLLGFDEIMLLNDHSTDETQCILDSYANNNDHEDENFVVRRIPDDMNAAFLTSQPFDQCSTIRACEEYLRHRGGPKYQHTWLLTHDVDEFIWFNNTQNRDDPLTEQPDSGSFKDTLRLLFHGQEQEHIDSGEGENNSLPPRMHSLKIPRLLFGSSGHDYHDPNKIVMERFTHRFDHKSCPPIIRRPTFWKTDFYHTSYCIAMSMEKKSIDNVKSMTWAPALPTTCRKGMVYGCELAHGQVDDRQRCITPHVHGLKKLPSNNVASSLRSPQQQGGSRSLDAESLLGTVAIMHYSTKSREEFFDRTCKSVWLQKYCQCPTCSPEASFNVTLEYANNFHDERMLPFASRVRDAMSSRQADMQDCNVQPPTSHRDWEYYRQCWKSRMNASTKQPQS